MYELTKLQVTTALYRNVDVYCRLDTNDMGVVYACMTFDEYKSKIIPYQDNDVFIDIGCHIGTWSLLMATYNPTFKVYSYDPVPENIEVLQKNIELNHLTNIKLYCMAIETDTLYIPNNPDAKFVVNPMGSGTNQQSFKSPIITIPDIFKDNNIDRVHVMKIDCEGCEIKAFLNTPIDILRRIDYIVGEFHPWGIGFKQFCLMFELDFINKSDLLERVNGKKDDELRFFFFQNRKV